MYTLSLVLAVRYGTEMMDVCHDFYHSILVIIMVGLNIIIMETLVNFLIKGYDEFPCEIQWSCHECGTYSSNR